MSHPKFQEQIPESNIEHLSTSSFDDAIETVTEFKTQPSFLRRLNDPSDIGTADYTKKLTEQAISYCRESRATTPDRELAKVLVLAGTPDMIQTELRLDQANSRPPAGRTKQKDKLKKRTVSFNKMMSSFMTDYPDTPYDDLVNAMTEVSLDHFTDQEVFVASTIGAIVRGARTEVASHQILRHTSLEWRAGTAEEDLRGGDIIVTNPNNQQAVSIDVKSSLSQLEALAASKKYNLGPTDCCVIDNQRIVIFPMVTSPDFENTCSLPDDMAMKIAPHLEKQIRLALLSLSIN